MKKLIAVVLIAASLGGCAQLQGVEAALNIGTATAANPVTPTRESQLEAGVTILFAALKTWKQSCVQGLINVQCKAQVAQVQVYTRQVPAYLVQLRSFVKNNDQINAIVLFNQITSLIATAKAQAAASGVNVGS